jgi:hypothetical protein
MNTKATGDDSYSKIDQENQEIERIRATIQNDLTSLLSSEHVGSIGPQLIDAQMSVQQEWVNSELEIPIEKALPYSIEPKPPETYKNEWSALGIDGTNEDRFEQIKAKKNDPAAAKLIEKAAVEKDLPTVMELMNAGVKPQSGDPIYLAATAYLLFAAVRNF